MIIVIAVIYAERHSGNVSDRDISQVRFSCRSNIGIQCIADLCFDKSKGTFHIFGKITLFRPQGCQNGVLHREDGISNLPGANTPIIFPVSCLTVRVSYCARGCPGRADAGDRSRTELSEIQRGLFLLFFYAKSCVYLPVLYQSQKRRERHKLYDRAKQRKIRRPVFSV